MICRITVLGRYNFEKALRNVLSSASVVPFHPEKEFPLPRAHLRGEKTKPNFLTSGLPDQNAKKLLEVSARQSSARVIVQCTVTGCPSILLSMRCVRAGLRASVMLGL